MPIRIACSNCQTPYVLSEAMSGKKVRCAKCKQVLVVPDVEEVDEDLQLEIVESDVATRAKKAPVSAVVDAQEPDSDDDEEEVVVFARKRSQVTDEDPEEEEERPKRRRKRKRRSKADTGGANLYRVALYQKIVLICVLVNIASILLLFVAPLALMVVIGLLLIPVSILSSIAIFLLTKELFGLWVAIFLGILSLIRLAVPIPLVGFVQLLILLVINGAATRLLKRNDLSVGLLGASLSEASLATDDESAGLDVATIISIVVLVLLGFAALMYGAFVGWPGKGGVPDRVGSRDRTVQVPVA